jgi:hypothetical protein
MRSFSVSFSSTISSTASITSGAEPAPPMPSSTERIGRSYKQLAGSHATGSCGPVAFGLDGSSRVEPEYPPQDRVRCIDDGPGIALQPLVDLVVHADRWHRSSVTRASVYSARRRNALDARQMWRILGSSCVFRSRLFKTARR